MFGAHLDGVSAGPGINDNGSGSSALLENALVLAAAEPDHDQAGPVRLVDRRGAGPQGSEFYVNSLSATQRGYIKGYYNFDMVGSTNGGYFINRITSATAAPLKAYWDSLGLAAGGERRGPGPLRRLLVRSRPASRPPGTPPGASARKTSAQATKWGGTAGAAYDPCYHRSCDTTSNINATVLNRSADGIAYAIWDARRRRRHPDQRLLRRGQPDLRLGQPGRAPPPPRSRTATTSGTPRPSRLSASGAAQRA